MEDLEKILNSTVSIYRYNHDDIFEVKTKDIINVYWADNERLNGEIKHLPYVFMFAQVNYRTAYEKGFASGDHFYCAQVANVFLAKKYNEKSLGYNFLCKVAGEKPKRKKGDYIQTKRINIKKYLKEHADEFAQEDLKKFLIE